jgi:hypothetical protein
MRAWNCKNMSKINLKMTIVYGKYHEKTSSLTLPSMAAQICAWATRSAARRKGEVTLK